MEVMQKLLTLQKAMKQTRTTGYTTALRKLTKNTDILVIACEAVEIPDIYKTDWNVLLKDVNRNHVPVFLDNGVLQELVSSAIRKITQLENVISDHILIPRNNYAVVDGFKQLTGDVVVRGKYSRIINVNDLPEETIIPVEH